MAGAHAIFSPSRAHRFVPCPGSVFLEQGKPDTTSEYAAEGTAAHELAAMALRAGNSAGAYLGRVISADGFTFTVDDEMVKAVDFYLDLVRAYVDWAKGELLVEQALPIGHLTGEDGAGGTGDCVVLGADEWIIADLKYGRGEQVDGEDNPQLEMYGLGALRAYEMLGRPKRLRLVIVQPRLDHVSEWAINVEDLEARAGKFLDAADAARLACQPSTDLKDFLSPGEKQCRWCKAKATCPALRGMVASTVKGTASSASPDEFEDISPKTIGAVTHSEADVIAKLLPRLDLIETWVAAVRSRGEELLHAGVPVEGWKLVEGKRGNRQWTDADAAEAKLKSFRLKHEEMFDYRLISPTTAEKVLKDQPKRWKALQDLITQAPGKATVAPASDKRAAITVKPVADHFTDVSAEAAAADLV